MKSTKSGKLVVLFVVICFVSLNLSAGYLVPPIPVSFIECCVSCGSCKPNHRPHHYKKIHHKYHKKYVSACNGYPSCAPKDFVVFINGPFQSGKARWVNTNEYDCYDPDMSTGDDDPIIYPGMNIDN